MMASTETQTTQTLTAGDQCQLLSENVTNQYIFTPYIVRCLCVQHPATSAPCLKSPDNYSEIRNVGLLQVFVEAV